MPYVETARGTFFYTLSQGPTDCPTLLLVHGAGGSRLHWPGELRRLGQARLPRATVYTLDLPGHGRSEGPGCNTISDYANTVVAFLDALRIEQAVIVGHSMGGAIAQTLALDFANPSTGHRGEPVEPSGQDRIAGLVLVATGARLRVAPAILEGIQSNFEGAAELVTRFAWSLDAPPALTELGRQAILETGPDVLLGDFTACDHFNVMERLAEIKPPTLIIVGDADQLTPPKYAHFLAEHIPNAQLALIEKAGHMVMLERPAETVQAVRDFWADLFTSQKHK